MSDLATAYKAIGLLKADLERTRMERDVMKQQLNIYNDQSQKIAQQDMVIHQLQLQQQVHTINRSSPPPKVNAAIREWLKSEITELRQKVVDVQRHTKEQWEEWKIEVEVQVKQKLQQAQLVEHRILKDAIDNVNQKNERFQQDLLKGQLEREDWQEKIALIEKEKNYLEEQNASLKTMNKHFEEEIETIITQHQGGIQVRAQDNDSQLAEMQKNIEQLQANNQTLLLEKKSLENDLNSFKTDLDRTSIEEKEKIIVLQKMLTEEREKVRLISLREKEITDEIENLKTKYIKAQEVIKVSQEENESYKMRIQEQNNNLNQFIIEKLKMQQENDEMKVKEQMATVQWTAEVQSLKEKCIFLENQIPGSFNPIAAASANNSEEMANLQGQIIESQLLQSTITNKWKGNETKLANELYVLRERYEKKAIEFNKIQETCMSSTQELKELKESIKSYEKKCRKLEEHLVDKENSIALLKSARDKLQVKLKEVSPIPPPREITSAVDPSAEHFDFGPNCQLSDFQEIINMWHQQAFGKMEYYSKIVTMLQSLQTTIIPFFDDRDGLKVIPWMELNKFLNELPIYVHNVKIEMLNQLLQASCRIEEQVNELKPKAQTIECKNIILADSINEKIDLLSTPRPLQSVEEDKVASHASPFDWQILKRNLALPIPAFEVNSHEVLVILESWTDDIPKQNSVLNWLINVSKCLMGNFASITLVKITREIVDAFVVLIVPILEKKGFYTIEVSTRQSPPDDKPNPSPNGLVSWDMKIEVFSKINPQQRALVEQKLSIIQQRLEKLQKGGF